MQSVISIPSGERAGKLFQHATTLFHNGDLCTASAMYLLGSQYAHEDGFGYAADLMTACRARCLFALGAEATANDLASEVLESVGTKGYDTQKQELLLEVMAKPGPPNYSGPRI